MKNFYYLYFHQNNYCGKFIQKFIMKIESIIKSSALNEDFKKKFYNYITEKYSSFIGNFLYRNLNLPDMILASIELGRRAYEFYNQYISRTKEQKKNIIQPDIKLFNELIIKSLEEFNIQKE